MIRALNEDWLQNEGEIGFNTIFQLSDSGDRQCRVGQGIKEKIHLALKNITP